MAILNANSLILVESCWSYLKISLSGFWPRNVTKHSICYDNVCLSVHPFVCLSV